MTAKKVRHGGIQERTQSFYLFNIMITLITYVVNFIKRPAKAASDMHLRGLLKAKVPTKNVDNFVDSFLILYKKIKAFEFVHARLLKRIRRFF